MITPLSVIPSRQNPTTFAVDMDQLLSELPRFVGEANALEQSLQLTATTGTSTTSLVVGTGSKTLTTQAGKAWAIGSFVYVVSAASVANLMIGQVTAYNSATGVLTVNAVSSSGSGTLASWVIGLSAPLGSSASFSGTVTAAVLQVDANFSLQLVGSNPTMTVASGSRYLEFDRAADTFNFVLGGTARFSVTPTDGPTRSSDASTANGLIRKSQHDAAQGNLAGAVTVSTSTALVSGDAGKLITVYGNAAPITLTLPSASGLGGKAYRIYNYSAHVVTVAAAGGAFVGDGSTSMPGGSQLTIISDGTNWDMFGGMGGFAGPGQKWVARTGMSLGVTYNNSSGRPIWVSAYLTTGAAASPGLVGATVDGIGTVDVVRLGDSNGGTYEPGHGCIKFPVPNGSNYQVYVASGSATLSQWLELR